MFYRPQYGGMHCQGDNKVYKMCNVKVYILKIFLSSMYKYYLLPILAVMLEQDRKYIDNTGDIWNNTFLQMSNVSYTSGKGDNKVYKMCNVKVYILKIFLSSMYKYYLLPILQHDSTVSF
jgi:predicted CDP-diglyceride synthetase/phosphatidate cytidylyltransferase